MTSLHTLSALNPRGIEDISAAAHAVQANVVALRVAWCRRTAELPEQHELETPAPGAVRRMREILIDHHILRDYSFEEIALRLRQVWGEFCALCWLFPHVDPQQPIAFDPLAPGQSIRCCADIQNKLHEVQQGLWRLRHEQTIRHNPQARNDPTLQQAHNIALAMPLNVYGQPVSAAPDEQVLCSACEYAGMLAALRWATDTRWTWEAPGIMDVTISAIP